MNSKHVCFLKFFLLLFTHDIQCLSSVINGPCHFLHISAHVICMSHAPACSGSGHLDAGKCLTCMQVSKAMMHLKNGQPVDYFQIRGIHRSSFAAQRHNSALPHVKASARWSGAVTPRPGRPSRCTKW